MRLSTHYIFSIGLLTFIFSLFTSFYTSFVLSALISIPANLIIDRLGHEERFGYVRRTPRTHTFPRSIAWGFIPAILVLIFLIYIMSVRLILPTVLAGIIVGPSHMLLDVFTEHGIYVKKNGRWHRFSLAHFRYDNPAVNGLAILAGALLLFLALNI
ncbi:MAG: DUF1286 domain-containing protein [Sulfolobaceae archaeon]|nr:DUF1286 domain-containing protein [Sulfolobaceae archaeon]